MLIQSVHILELLFAVDGSDMGMDRASDADLLLFQSLFFIFLLKFPNFVDVTMAGGNLVLFFDERVLSLELLLLGNIRVLGEVQPSVIDFLGFFPKALDTVDVSVVVWLMLEGGLVTSGVVKDVVLWVVLSLVDKDISIEFLNFNIPRVV